MKEKIKGLRLNITISGIISIVIGVLLLIYPTESLTTISRVIAAIVILSGIFVIISQIFDKGFNAMGIAVGGVLAVIGIWIFLAPGSIVSIIPIAIGVLLVVHGLQDLGLAAQAIKTKAPRPWLTFIIAAVTILLGVACIADAFKFIAIATRLIGIMLIYDGITDVFTVHKVNKAEKIIDVEVLREEDV
ncbi:Uncharacterized membrane protein HdeD, DUF308 family [Pseudobutyrivibrio sp. 49]|uniref:HdeD family acid-resistance protein n=1 Tax=unclassified Pseudobutyrivibrio TaxID=2638619 RepID=UPI0008889B37|nr:MULTISPECIES: DUF308 domain-containing protein [unclassified Pseudobutyrivibrio]SDH26517.1 Uncharacterized membrane protein HdeD, DUF308 family [Pseudobutyrivibrio sp. 49]SFO17025.1 Uncharacterized membrane protein HdeD, DUF308 family [Pseudobutyrivibrio sp. UC1225]